MKMYLISDNIDTQTGFRLAGVDGSVVHDERALREAVAAAERDGDVGVLIFTEKAADIGRDYVNSLKLSKQLPLIIEIPDRHGSHDVAGSINKLVQESVGLKL